MNVVFIYKKKKSRMNEMTVLLKFFINHVNTYLNNYTIDSYKIQENRVISSVTDE